MDDEIVECVEHSELAKRPSQMFRVLQYATETNINKEKTGRKCICGLSKNHV